MHQAGGIITAHNYESDIIRDSSERFMVREIGQIAKQFYSASEN